MSAAAADAEIESRIRDRLIVDLTSPGRTLEIDDATNLFEQDVLDSLGVFVMVGFIEDDFGVKIRDSDVTVQNFMSVNAIARLVRRKQQS